MEPDEVEAAMERLRWSIVAFQVVGGVVTALAAVSMPVLGFGHIVCAVASAACFTFAFLTATHR